MNVSSIITAIIGVILGFVSAHILLKKSAKSVINKAEEEAKKIIEEAKRESKKQLEEIKIEKRKAEVELKEYKSEIENQLKEQRNEIQKLEDEIRTKKIELENSEISLQRRLDEINKKEEAILKKEEELLAEKEELIKKEEEIASLKEEFFNKLQEIAGMSAEEAKEELKNQMIEKAKQEAEHIIREIKEKAEEEGKKEAKRILSLAIQKCSVDHTVDTTVTVVQLPSDEMKGRIIGRTGRNIRAFESATGVDVIVDDTPEAVVLSSFDPIRREVAKLTLEKLIVDGRIHPTRIEELIQKSQEEIAEIIKETGSNTVYELGIVGLHPELVKLVGKLKYRTSYGQSILQHSIEVAYLSSFIAGELGLDTQIAKRAGLLHDIGKAVDREQEGTHALIGADLASKYGENELIVNAIAAHHEEVEAISPYAMIVSAADSISSSRPGARKETLETYIKRVKKLEEIANSFEGVKNSYAVQAGREIRVIVEPEKVSDERASLLANEIAEKIQEEMQYPGYIKVNIIREVRYTSYAK